MTRVERYRPRFNLCPFHHHHSTPPPLDNRSSVLPYQPLHRIVSTAILTSNHGIVNNTITRKLFCVAPSILPISAPSNSNSSTRSLSETGNSSRNTSNCRCGLSSSETGNSSHNTSNRRCCRRSIVFKILEKAFDILVGILIAWVRFFLFFLFHFFHRLT